MTVGTQTDVLVRAQWLVQNSRSIPNAVHRTFGRFSEVGTEPFLDPGQFPWTALLEQHYPAIRAEAERVLQVRDALPNFQDIAPDQIAAAALRGCLLPFVESRTMASGRSAHSSAARSQVGPAGIGPSRRSLHVRVGRWACVRSVNSKL